MSKFVICIKERYLTLFYCITKVAKPTFSAFKKKASLANTIHHSPFIYNQFKKLNLCKFYPNLVMSHFISIQISIFYL